MIHGVENSTPPQESTVGITAGEVGPLNGCMLGGFLLEASFQLLVTPGEMKTFSITLGPVRHSSNWKHLVFFAVILYPVLLICLVILRRKSQLSARVPCMRLELCWNTGASPRPRLQTAGAKA